MPPPQRTRRSARRDYDADFTYDEAPGIPFDDAPTIGILAFVGLLLLAQSSLLPDRLQLILTMLATGGLLAVIVLCRAFADDLWTAVRRGPNPLIVLMLLWGGYSVTLTEFRAHGAVEWMRLVSGASAYLLAGYCLTESRQLNRVTVGLLLFGVGICLYDMSQFGGLGQHIKNSILGTHQDIGSLLALLLPFVFAFAVSPETEEKPRLFAIAGALTLGMGLILHRSRSAWIATALSLILLFVLITLYSNDRRKPKKRTGNPIADLIGSPLLLALGAMILLVTMGGIAPYLSKRVNSLVNVPGDASFQARIDRWHGAALMARERPMTGWGLGTFLVREAEWTHVGDDRTQVLSAGTGHQNNAHNYYAQMAADTGIVGVTLHFAAVVAFLIVAVKGLKQGVASPFRRTLLIGSICAVTAATIDAFTSPAYTYHGIFSVWSVCMGLGIAALRPDRRAALPGVDSVGAPALPEATSWTVWSAAILLGLLFAAGFPLYGERLRQQGETAPRGHLVFDVEPKDWKVKPGTSVVFQAIYIDPKGEKQSTFPGLRWEVQVEPRLASSTEMTVVSLSDYKNRRNYAGMRIVVPKTDIPLTVKATYIDPYGRPIVGAATVVADTK